MRWGIEVYFTEVKQNLGFLEDQTGDYTCHYASIHTAGIRHLLFTHAFLQSREKSFCGVRNQISEKLEIVTYAGLLWELFQILIDSALNQFTERLGETVLSEIRRAIGLSVTEFFERALKIDKASFNAEQRAKKWAISN